MIEISERYAAALNAAVKILVAMNLTQDQDPLSWIRKMDLIQEAQGVCIIRCTFWINGSPHDYLDFDIQLSARYLKSTLPWLALVRYPHSDRIDRWDFDNEGRNPFRVK